MHMVMSPWRFSVFVLVSWAAAALFFSGFLLSKREIMTRGGAGCSQQTREGREEACAHACIPGGNSYSNSSGQEEQEACDSLEWQRQGPRRRKFKRAFLFVVDALRLDFMTLHPPTAPPRSPGAPHEHGEARGASPSSSSSFNRFKQMHRLLRENSSQCTLLGFRADPPTTTSQRLKGLMTGGLPAFVEFGANFHSSAVAEDSLVDQWVRDGKHLFMAGDDTWLRLFPDAFTKNFPFDSFNTRDLDTVDDGILRHLFPLLGTTTPDFTTGATTTSTSATASSKAATAATCLSANTSSRATEAGAERSEGDWDVFIAHFLGVDHIGHTHDAHHPAMGARLGRMDSVLAAVIARLQEEDEAEGGDSLVLLFGDHGMTDAGEHGGNSLEETMSGLFVYSTGHLFPAQDVVAGQGGEAIGEGSEGEEGSSSLTWDSVRGAFSAVPPLQVALSPRVVAQVDLAPSLALLLGNAIPYTSLGQVIPELFAEGSHIPTAKGIHRGEVQGGGELTEAFRDNAKQVMRYLLHYFLSRGAERDGVSPTSLPDLRAGDVDVALLEGAAEACFATAEAFPFSGDELLQQQEIEECFRHAIYLAVQRVQDRAMEESASSSVAVPMSVCTAPTSESSPHRFGFARLTRFLFSWWGQRLCDDIDELYHQFLWAICTHTLLDRLLLSPPPLDPTTPSPKSYLLLSAVRKQTHILVQWSHFNVNLMVCGLVLSVLCYLYSLWSLHFLASSPGFSSFSSYMTCSLLAFHWLSPLSNSFVIEEASVYFFQVQVISLLRLWDIASVCLRSWSSQCERERDGWRAVGSPLHSEQKQRSRNDTKWEQHPRTYMLGAALMELCALCITRWLLYLSRGSVIPAAATYDIDGVEGEGEGQLLLQLWWHLVGPLLFFVVSFWFLVFWLSVLTATQGRVPAGSDHAARGSGVCTLLLRASRPWCQWVVEERVASKLLFMAAAVALLPHCAKNQTGLLGGADETFLVTSTESCAEDGTGFAVANRLLVHLMRALLPLLQTDWFQTGGWLPFLVLACSGAGLCLEIALRWRKWGGKQHQHWFILQSALHIFAHVSNVIILVSVSVQHQSILLVSGQLWFSACLLTSCALCAAARRRDMGVVLENMNNKEEPKSGEQNLMEAQEFNRSQRQHVFQLAVQLSAMGRLLFFLSHHQYDFGTMQLAAGLVGASSFHFWRAGCLVGINTAGHSLLGYVSLLALAVTATAALPRHSLPEKEKEKGREMLVMWAVSASGVGRVVGSMCAALLLRRHLMLWAVFAPKVIFEAAFWLVDSCCLLLLCYNQNQC